MEVVSYLFYKGRIFIYLALALLFSLSLSFFAGYGAFLRLSILLFLELWLLRLVDDRADYDKDRTLGRRQLGREVLSILIILFSTLFSSLNVILFGSGGFFSIALLILIVFKAKSAYLPPLIGPLSGVYYLGRYLPLASMAWELGLFLLVIFCLSVAYAIYKRMKR